jgi:TPR repeat protein
LSAQHGFAEAQRMLGDIYYHGLPEQNYSQNYSQAYIWFALAAENGSAQAPLLRYETAAFLSPAELIAAQQEMAKYKAQQLP